MIDKMMNCTAVERYDFAERIYGIKVNLPLINPTRHMLMAIPFLVSDLPILVLTDSYDPNEAQRALRLGAQDVLSCSRARAPGLRRALRHALERHAVVSDLLEARHQAQFVATHDPLTQLPNRVLLREQLSREMAQLETRHEQARLTTEFLRRELTRSEQELRAANRKITEFQRTYRGELPSDRGPTVSKLERLEQLPGSAVAAAPCPPIPP